MMNPLRLIPEPKEIEYDSEGREMRLIKGRQLEDLKDGIPSQFWTAYTEPGRTAGWGFYEGTERVAFKSYYGKWMQANYDDLDQHLSADGVEGPWAKFSVEPIMSNLIALKSDFNKYLVCNKNGSAEADKYWLLWRETFWVYAVDNCDSQGTDPGTNCVAFKNFASNKWLVAGSDGSIDCTSESAGPQEKWFGWKTDSQATDNTQQTDDTVTPEDNTTDPDPADNTTTDDTTTDTTSPSYETFADWVYLGEGYDAIFLAAEANVVYGYTQNYSIPMRMTGWVSGNSFSNYATIGTAGKIYGQGAWVSFGQQLNYYSKENMVRYGNSPDKWTKPRYVAGYW